MNNTNELKKIKKEYGEEFMQFCRNNFPQILEEKGELYKVLKENFSNNSKDLYKDIKKYNLEDNFKIYINYKAGKQISKQIKTDKKPVELLEEAGYDLFECKTNDDIKKFKKYYKNNELLCTFIDKYRLTRNIVFFAVKKNVDEIKREDFKNPQREDEYGTSVMSLQFSKGKYSFLSIKNRYNSTVFNPDNTYNNDLDNIIPGLEYSFKIELKEKYGLNFDNDMKIIEDFEIPKYVQDKNGKFYKYNYCINGNYYCPQNIIINKKGEVTIVSEPEQGILMDYFYMDLKNKSIYAMNNIEDSFVNDLKDINKIEVLGRKIISDEDKKKNISKIIKLEFDKEKNKKPVIIGLDNNNNIVKYENENIKIIENNYLLYNTELNDLKLENANIIKDDFLSNNKKMISLNLPNVTNIGDKFIKNNKLIENINLPEVQYIGNFFLRLGANVKELKVPKLINIGNEFLCNNQNLLNLSIPSVEKIGDRFMYANNFLKKLFLPNVKFIGNDFLHFNRDLNELNINNIENIGKNALKSNNNIDIDEIIKNLKQNKEENLIDKKQIIKDSIVDVTKNNVTLTEIDLVDNINKKMKKKLEDK